MWINPLLKIVPPANGRSAQMFYLQQTFYDTFEGKNVANFKVLVIFLHQNYILALLVTGEALKVVNINLTINQINKSKQSNNLKVLA